MQYSLLALALSTLSLAAPLAKQDQFTVHFSTTSGILAANLDTPDGAQPGHFILKGQSLTAFPAGGLPAYLSGGTVNKDLVFDTTKIFGDGVATAIAPEIGSTQGIAKPIEVVQGNDVHDLEWGVLGDGQIYHLKAQEGNRFYACKTTIRGTEVSVLSWGNPGNYGMAPEGCEDTEVTKGSIPK